MSSVFLVLLTKMFNYNIRRTIIRKDYDDIYKDVISTIKNRKTGTSKYQRYNLVMVLCISDISIVFFIFVVFLSELPILLRFCFRLANQNVLVTWIEKLPLDFQYGLKSFLWIGLKHH